MNNPSEFVAEAWRDTKHGLLCETKLDRRREFIQDGRLFAFDKDEIVKISDPREPKRDGLYRVIAAHNCWLSTWSAKGLPFELYVEPISAVQP